MRLECVPTERAGAGKLDGLIRLKDYIGKPEVLGHFTPVYDVASRCLGCTWGEANKVAMVDTVGCNLDCFYCYQKGRSTDSAELAVPDLVNLFVEDGIDSPVWRVSGGEPLLQEDTPRLLAELTETAESTGHLVMLNTNGTRHFDLPISSHLLVEVSVKGLCPEWADWVASHGGLLQRQLDTVCDYVEDGHMVMLNLVCLAPAGTDADDALRVARRLRDDLADIDETLPLRVTPVVAKRYDWCPEWPGYVDYAAAWREAVAQRYGWIDCATPAAAFLGIGGEG